MIPKYDVVVIGGGMAGASVAARLSGHASVAVLEMEQHPAYHSTGRSAAVISETYGNDTVRALTRASRAFLESPPPGFCAGPILKPRPILLIAREAQATALETFLNSLSPNDRVESKSAQECLHLYPLLKPDGLLGGAWIESSADMDVHALHQGYLRLLQSQNGTIRTHTRVNALERLGDGWRVTTEHGPVDAGIVVNAAGAWAGQVGAMAGSLDIGLQALRRTACLIRPPQGESPERWPALLDAEELFYLKPEAGMLMLSPADETLTEPCDAQADDMDVAVAVDRIERATTLDVRHVSHKWAGLRSFVKDRSPVVGYDPLRPGFFWLAALGGYGIQTAPALSRLAAALILDLQLDQDLLARSIDVTSVSPGRLDAHG